MNIMSDFTTLVNQLNQVVQAIYTLDNSLNDLLPQGAYHPVSLADASASDNSVYFSTDANYLVYKDDASVVHPLYYTTLNGTIVWDPGSLADGAGETSSGITVTGAAFGDYVMVSAPYDLQGIIASAYVSASNTVKIRIQNETTGVLDLASGTWKVRVIR